MTPAVVFDLDGTLVDSIDGIQITVAQAMAEILPGRKVPGLRPLIGPPIATILATAMPDVPEPTIAAIVARFRTLYDADGWRHTAPYPGAEAVLRILREAGVRCFVCTHKPWAPTRQILGHWGLLRHFEEVLSPDKAPTWHDKADALAYLESAYGLDPQTSWMVGDGPSDRDAAAARHYRFVPVLFGYGGLEKQASAQGLRSLTELGSWLGAIAPALELLYDHQS